MLDAMVCRGPRGDSKAAIAATNAKDESLAPVGSAPKSAAGGGARGRPCEENGVSEPTGGTVGGYWCVRVSGRAGLETMAAAPRPTHAG